MIDATELQRAIRFQHKSKNIHANIARLKSDVLFEALFARNLYPGTLNGLFPSSIDIIPSNLSSATCLT